MNSPEVEKRLGKIEEKIDKLADIVVSVALAEEKIRHCETSLNLILEKLNDIDIRQREIEKKSTENDQKLSGMYRFFWILVSTVTTALAGSIILFNHTQ